VGGLVISASGEPFGRQTSSIESIKETDFHYIKVLGKGSFGKVSGKHRVFLIDK
jgi:hypothetical protein